MDTSNDLTRRWEESRQFDFKCTPLLGKVQGSRGHGRDRPPSSSLLGERVIYGRGKDHEMLVGFLTSETAISESLNIVAIVGAGGVGKTTLVQHIYNDPKVSKHFNLRGWVCASKGLQVMELMRKIGESLTRKPCSHNQLGVVQDLLKSRINCQRFLLVVDDVWYETVDGDQWEMLRATLRGCAGGSVIILTSHYSRVADRTETVPSYFLECLSDDNCWRVFQEHAFGCLHADARLVEIGKKIAKECQGLPLVAKALGVRLRHESDAEKWAEFLQRDIWDAAVSALESSYGCLPAHMKRCFAYSSMLPQGCTFSTLDLVCLWMAQGFIRQERETPLEDVGRAYVDHFALMSFFRRSESDTRLFVMPRLFHALAQSMSSGECLAVEVNNLSSLPRSDLQQVRHLTLIPSNNELTTQSLSLAEHLRSFYVVPTCALKDLSLCSVLRRLRVLDVRHTDIKDLPSTIGDLKHLRYLNLSGTKIRDVHPSVFKLYNLQTLDLSHTGIRQLPDLFANLELLCFLSLSHTRIQQLAVSVWKLPNLRFLTWNRLK